METVETAFGIGKKQLGEGVERGTRTVLDGEDQIAERSVRAVENG